MVPVLCRKIVQGKKMGSAGPGAGGKGVAAVLGRAVKIGLTDWILFEQWGSKPQGGLRGKNF